MKLTRAQRNRILAGDNSPLIYDAEPEVEKGCIYVLSWARESRSHVGQGDVAVTPAQPLRWLTVTAVVRRSDGRWSVRFDVTDRRSPRRLPRRTPPVYSPDMMKADQSHTLDAAEIHKARLESNYTTDIRAAADSADGVGDATLEDYTLDARNRERAAKLELVSQMRVLDEALTQRLKNLPQNSCVDGEIRRARRQVRDAMAKLDRQIRVLERIAA